MAWCASTSPLQDDQHHASHAVDHWFPDAEERLSTSNAGRLVDKWGAGGLAVGSIAVGPSMTLVGVLLLGVDRVRFLTWYVPLTVVGFGVMTAFWVAIGLQVHSL